VLLAFPVAMALATGVEAPSSAIAQLDQLDDAGRERFGRITLWLTFAFEGSLTAFITLLAVRLRVGIPGRDSTMIAEVAQGSVGSGTLFWVRSGRQRGVAEAQAQAERELGS
jgi:hypothetical protein